MLKNGFSEDFLWGTATSSYQVEGGWNLDGRGPSIWDTFARIPGNIRNGHTGNTACDHYHRFKDDIKLMKDIGIKAYRFSVAWPRIFPDGKGTINNKGLDFYSILIDSLLEAGIKPVPTLYHWDLPQAIEDGGGWRNRDTSYRFADYAETLFREFDDRVYIWLTLNEPFCSAFLGHLWGEHAPGLKNAEKAYDTLHHLLLSHGLAMQKYRENYNTKPIGIVLNLSTPRPATCSEKDIHAAEMHTDFTSRMFMDPLFKKGYPESHLKLIREHGIQLPIQQGDIDLIRQKQDVLGLNYYLERTISADSDSEMGYRSVSTHYKKTDMGWDIVPEGLLRQLRWVNKNYNLPEIYITENGCAVEDKLNSTGTMCHDPERIDYLKEHIMVIKKAINEGINIKGYFLWSFMDNFEWTYGYTKRFGIVYCDHENQHRIPKDSYYYYRKVIAGLE